MSAPSGHGMLLTTVPSRADAARIAQLLIEEKLAACVQLLPIESFYVWDGKTQNENELLLLIKTRTALFDTAIARIKAAHPYSVPQIVGTSFVAGFQGYLDWIDTVTGRSQIAPEASPASR
jgi:periplasmic divalent cation tolerance protein